MGEAAREAQWKRFHEPKKPAGNENAPPGAQVPPRAAPQQNKPNLPSRGTQAPQRPLPSRFNSFSEFDACWLQFEARVKSGAQSLRHADVPWPTSLPTVSGVSADESPDVQKQKLRAALVRWHPDKWGNLLESIQEGDRKQVVEKVKEVTRRIIA